MTKLEECKVIKQQTSPTGADQKIVDIGKEVSVKDWSDKEVCKTRYFCVSGVDAMFSGWEVLVFPCTKEGKVIDFIEVAGGKGRTHEQAIEELKEEFNIMGEK